MKIFRVYILFGIIGVGYSASLKSRLDFLEMQVSREAFNTRTDIIELRDLISVMNATGLASGDGIADSPIVETKLNSLDEKLERFMQEQHDKNVAFSNAIRREKAMTRKMLKVIQDLADSNTESVLEIEQAVEQSKVEREMFKRDWTLFEDEIKKKLNDMTENTKLLQSKFENFDGTIVIQGVQKKEPCPKNWFQDGKTCYLYQKNEKLSWYGARIRCGDLGGKLAEPDTEDKMLYILLTVDENNVWIGATDEENEGNWVWASSQKLLDFNVVWQPGQPNNLYANQHCMEIGLSSMNDESCFEDNYYICEKAVAE